MFLSTLMIKIGTSDISLAVIHLWLVGIVELGGSLHVLFFHCQKNTLLINKSNL
jgi:hypothetical protein